METLTADAMRRYIQNIYAGIAMGIEPGQIIRAKVGGLSGTNTHRSSEYDR